MKTKPTLIELLARVHVSLADIDGREPLREASELVPVGADCNGRPARLAPEAAAAWRAMCGAGSASGVELLLVSAFRSYEQQTRLWERKLRAGLTPGEIRRTVAVPGFSQHHTGCAVDVGAPGCTDLTERFEATPEFAWLTEHGAKFGFAMPYGRENSLGVVYEPWHWSWRENSSMKMSYTLEGVSDRLNVIVTGHWVMGDFRPMLETIRAECQRLDLKRVFVDGRGVTNEVPPVDRFEAGKQVASLFLGIKIALVFDSRRITRLAENTAVNRGADMAIFGEPAEALAWLHGDSREAHG